ncbi:MAG: 4Fe-4S binding protein [archaeon]
MHNIIEEEKNYSYTELISLLLELNESEFLNGKENIINYIKFNSGEPNLAIRLSNIKYKENFLKLLRKKELCEINKNVQGENKNIVTVGLNLYASHVRLTLDKEKCILCDVSHTICPKEAISVKEDIIINNKCIFCGLCVPFCPTGALSIARDDKNTPAVIENKSLPLPFDSESINHIAIKRIFDGTISVDADKCPEKCEECVVACSTAAIKLDNNKIVVNSNDCVLCGACKVACPKNAIIINRNRLLVKDSISYSASFNVIVEKLLGKNKPNIMHNAESLYKITTLIKDSELKKYAE